MNVNREQAAALATLIEQYPGPVRIEGGPGGVRYVTIRDAQDEEVRYSLDLYGEVQGAIPER